MSESKFLTGNEAAVLGAIDAGAEVMFGYPITPATEILHGWIEKARTSHELQYLQTEDEIAAGFGVLGSVLAGTKAFTASAGPGHILLQDAIAMAENMRLPFVGIMMQRGGPSTGTVNFSQQEVNLAAFGGNGDGLRVVYSASTVEEMYELVLKAFSIAWKFRFPTFVLGDGYLGKMKATIQLRKSLRPVASKPILKEEASPTYIRNCYSSEELLAEHLRRNIQDWEKMSPRVAESETLEIPRAKGLIVAHGLVASACKEAVLLMSKQRDKASLFRPITLNPLDWPALLHAAKKVKKIYIVESSLNQLSRIIKYYLAGQKIKIFEISKPAEGFTAEEIINRIGEING